MAKPALKKKARTTRKRRISAPDEARRAKSPFEKHRGIGNPGIPTGRKAIVHAIRRLRGR